MEHSTSDANDSPPAQSHHRQSQACPITPRRDPGGDLHSCIVDYRREPFMVTWSGYLEYPDLTGFPALDDAEVTPVPLPPALAAAWKDSSRLDHGCHASVRASDRCGDRHPILKVAHPDPHSVDLIEREFRILRDLRGRGLPVPEVDTQPIEDDGRIYGYRMGLLRKLDRGELRARQGDVRRALLQLHAAGVCHGDVHPGNVMKDGNGEIVLIDFGFAGRIGSAVPPLIPSWVYAGSVFAAEDDLNAFDDFIAV